MEYTQIKTQLILPVKNQLQSVFTASAILHFSDTVPLIFRMRMSPGSGVFAIFVFPEHGCCRILQ